jgi:excisionase family DNA binding protein
MQPYTFPRLEFALASKRPGIDRLDGRDLASYAACFVSAGFEAVRDFECVMPTSKLFTPREAAQVLAVSYPTLKQWIYKMKMCSVKTAGGHHRIPEREVDRFLHRASEGGEAS